MRGFSDPCRRLRRPEAQARELYMDDGFIRPRPSLQAGFFLRERSPNFETPNQGIILIPSLISQTFLRPSG